MSLSLLPSLDSHKIRIFQNNVPYLKIFQLRLVEQLDGVGVLIEDICLIVNVQLVILEVEAGLGSPFSHLGKETQNDNLLLFVSFLFPSKT